MAVQLSTYSEPLEGPSRMGKNMNTSSLSMSAPKNLNIKFYKINILQIGISLNKIEFFEKYDSIFADLGKYFSI